MRAFGVHEVHGAPGQAPAERDQQWHGRNLVSAGERGRRKDQARGDAARCSAQNVACHRVPHRGVQALPQRHQPIAEEGIGRRSRRQRRRPGRRQMKHALLTGGLLALLTACSGARHGFEQAFTKRWQSDHGYSATQLYERLKEQQPSAGTQVAVGVSTQGLVGKPLAQGPAWTYSGRVDTVPQVSGNVVAFTSGEQLVALDANSGRVLWKLDTGKRKLRGIGDDGTLSAVSLDDVKGTELGQVLLIGRDGNVKHRYELRAPIGVPAVHAGVAFVPWANQYVTAIDGTTGEEMARILLRHQVSHATNIGGELY